MRTCATIVILLFVAIACGGDAADFCDEANAMDFDWLSMTYDLDGGRESCR